MTHVCLHRPLVSLSPAWPPDAEAAGRLVSLLRRRHLDEFAIVGYNDIPIVSRLPTPLTSVRVPFDQIAADALDLLTRGPATSADRLRIAAPTLIPRRSTAPPAATRAGRPRRVGTDIRPSAR